MRSLSAFGLLLAGTALLASATEAAVSVSGLVIDLNGNPIEQAQVIFDRVETAPGASVVTVFTGDDGAFDFPGSYPEATGDSLPITVRALGYETLERTTKTPFSGSR
jgi:hypothetical protein